MYLYQYALLAGFTCLLFKSNTRFAASVFLLGWFVYLTLFIDAGSSYKYMACATIEAAIAYVLNSRYRVVAYLGYSLIFVNMYGLILIKINSYPLSYDIVYAIISVTQFLFLLMRAIPNGLNRLHRKHFVVRAVNFDSRGAYDRMYKNTTKKGSDR